MEIEEESHLDPSLQSLSLILLKKSGTFNLTTWEDQGTTLAALLLTSRTTLRPVLSKPFCTCTHDIGNKYSDSA